jgi:hypothetical protein
MQCIVALQPQEMNEQKLGCIYPVRVAGQRGTGAGAQQQAPRQRR